MKSEDAAAVFCYTLSSLDAVTVGSMLTLFFSAGPVTDYATAKTADTTRFATFFRNMRDRGVFLPPSQFEAMFVGLAHSEADIDDIVAAARASLV